MRGFSLIEVMLAMGLLATGLLVLAQVLTAAITTNIAAKHLTAATALAAPKVEEVRAAGSAIGGIEYLDDRGRVLASGDRPPIGAAYARRWTVDALPERLDGPLVIQVVVEPISMSAFGPRVRIGSAGLTAALPRALP